MQMARLDGKVAFISGIARGQGRSHAIRFAEEGANIVGFDICENIDTVPYALATEEDLQETVDLVEKAGGKIVARKADARSLEQTRAVLDEGLEQFGHVDIVVCNAGYSAGYGLVDPTIETLMGAFGDNIDTMLTGALNTIVAALPALMSQGTGGSIVITSSTAGLKSMMGKTDTPEKTISAIGYTAAKTGVIGIMRALAGSLAHLSIRVNTVHPTGVNTKFVNNEVVERQARANEGWKNAMPVGLLEPVEVSNALVWLCSEEAKYVTGVELPVDAGFLVNV